MQFGKISGLAIACAAVAMPICSDSALAVADPVQPAPASKADTRAPQPSKARAEKIDDFVEGNLAFILLHEMAHALISEFGLMIPAKEEDTADRFAAYMMVQTRPMEELFKDAIIGWYARADQTKSVGNEFRSRHSPDLQRAEDAVCLLYGTDPPRFKSLADEYNLAKEVREPCNSDATNNGQSWFEVLVSHMVAGTLEDRATVPPAGPDFMTIEYEQTTIYKAERDFLIKNGLLEEVRNGFRRNFMVRDGIALTAEECGGEANAFWNKAERKLTICYGLIAQYRKIAEETVGK